MRVCLKGLSLDEFIASPIVTERFWAKVRLDGPTIYPELGPCWTWTGPPTTGGYGKFWLQCSERAHRAAWRLFVGPIPDGLDVCHRCDNRLCVRITHLFVGTRAENNYDRDSKGRHASAAQTHCKRGHEFTPENTRLDDTNRRHCPACAREHTRQYRLRSRSPSDLPRCSTDLAAAVSDPPVAAAAQSRQAMTP